MSHESVTGDTAPPQGSAATRGLRRPARRDTSGAAAAPVPGATGRGGARRTRDRLTGHGVRDRFHAPIARFGAGPAHDRPMDGRAPAAAP
ncbi:hypothetical protein SUDANB121_02237 [Nocardiopsis dassonvillei]|uniref:hypothetical protein n=1 Tax=Nocardiopsis dassonvillei TaxID=2014 RepID=UPI003F560A9A